MIWFTKCTVYGTSYQPGTSLVRYTMKRSLFRQLFSFVDYQSKLFWFISFFLVGVCIMTCSKNPWPSQTARCCCCATGYVLIDFPQARRRDNRCVNAGVIVRQSFVRLITAFGAEFFDLYHHILVPRGQIGPPLSTVSTSSFWLVLSLFLFLNFIRRGSEQGRIKERVFPMKLLQETIKLKLSTLFFLYSTKNRWSTSPHPRVVNKKPPFSCCTVLIDPATVSRLSNI